MEILLFIHSFIQEQPFHNYRDTPQELEPQILTTLLSSILNIPCGILFSWIKKDKVVKKGIVKIKENGKNKLNT